MLSFITLVFAFGSMEAAITNFTWRDCNLDPNRTIQFQQLTVSPVPLVSPGPLHLTAVAVITKQIPRFELQLNISRHVSFKPGVFIHVPCWKTYGSCIHDGCSLLDDMVASTSQAEHDVAVQIQQLFTDTMFNYHFPVPYQTLNVSDVTITLPVFSKLLAIMVDGDYTMEARLLNTDDEELYGCLTFNISIKHTCIGWGCYGRRR